MERILDDGLLESETPRLADFGRRTETIIKKRRVPMAPTAVALRTFVGEARMTKRGI